MMAEVNEIPEDYKRRTVTSFAIREDYWIKFGNIVKSTRGVRTSKGAVLTALILEYIRKYEEKQKLEASSKDKEYNN